MTTEPVRPGFHYYELILDPWTPDHRSRKPDLLRMGAEDEVGLEAPDPELDFYAGEDVPHGEVRVRWYRSKTTGQHRQVYVSTRLLVTTATEKAPVSGARPCSTARGKTRPAGRVRGR